MKSALYPPPPSPLIGLTCALTHVPPAAAAKKLSGEKEKRVYNCHFFHWQNEARENGRMRHSKHDIGVLQEQKQSVDLDFFLSDHTLSIYQPEILILIVWQCHPCARARPRPPSPTPHEISERISRPAVRKLISLLPLDPPLASRRTALQQGNIKIGASTVLCSP